MLPEIKCLSLKPCTMKTKINVNIVLLCLQDETPLFLAAREGSIDASRVLLDNYCNRDITDHMDRLPRDIAHERMHHDIVKLLDEYRVSSPVTMTNGYTSPQMMTSYVPQVKHKKRSRKQSNNHSSPPKDLGPVSPHDQPNVVNLPPMDHKPKGKKKRSTSQKGRQRQVSHTVSSPPQGSDVTSPESHGGNELPPSYETATSCSVPYAISQHDLHGLGAYSHSSGMLDDMRGLAQNMHLNRSSPSNLDGVNVGEVPEWMDPQLVHMPVAASCASTSSMQGSPGSTVASPVESTSTIASPLSHPNTSPLTQIQSPGHTSLSPGTMVMSPPSQASHSPLNQPSPPSTTSPMSVTSPIKKNFPTSPTHMLAMNQRHIHNQGTSPPTYQNQVTSPPMYQNQVTSPPTYQTSLGGVGGIDSHGMIMTQQQQQMPYLMDQYPTPPSQHGHYSPDERHMNGLLHASENNAYLTPSPDSPSQWDSSSPNSAHSDWSAGSDRISSPPQPISNNVSKSTNQQRTENGGFYC